jgi:hypothetical protein
MFMTFNEGVSERRGQGQIELRGHRTRALRYRLIQDDMSGGELLVSDK